MPSAVHGPSRPLPTREDRSSSCPPDRRIYRSRPNPGAWLRHPPGLTAPECGVFPAARGLDVVITKGPGAAGVIQSMSPLEFGPGCHPDDASGTPSITAFVQLHANQSSPPVEQPVRWSKIMTIQLDVQLIRIPPPAPGGPAPTARPADGVKMHSRALPPCDCSRPHLQVRPFRSSSSGPAQSPLGCR
jgi:hypothetical protein